MTNIQLIDKILNSSLSQSEKTDNDIIYLENISPTNIKLDPSTSKLNQQLSFDKFPYQKDIMKGYLKSNVIGFGLDINQHKLIDNLETIENNQQKSSSLQFIETSENQKTQTDFTKEILSLISEDTFIDGEISRSERFMQSHFNNNTRDYILNSLSQIYNQYALNINVCIGVISMLSRVSYKQASPVGPLLCGMGVAHKSLQVKDRAVKTFEVWNSKESLPILLSIDTKPEWFQDYVNNVIQDIKSEGIA